MTTTIEATAATALATETLKRLEGAPLGEFLSRQRWFSGKHDGATATLIEVLPLFPSCDAVLAQVDVREHQGSGVASYLVPMALTDAAVDPHIVIAQVRTGTATLSLIDAVHDVRFRESLLRYMIDKRRFTTDGTQLRFTRYDNTGYDPQALGSRVSPAEQSNTSIIYGDAVILKLFRRLTPGENPDIEIGAYLTERHVDVTPMLLGAGTIDGDRGPIAILMAQRLVPDADDLWRYVSEQLRTVPAERKPFVDEAIALGRTTRELHEALAAGADKHAFAPERGTRDDVVRWCSAIRREVADSVALLKRTDLGVAPADTPTRRDRSSGTRPQIIAQGLRDIEQSEAVLRDVAILEGAIDTDIGLKIRHHGDYHLGQVLRDGSGCFYVIDFEGEPTRPLAERRALHSPLRDVAGMMRSFAYAASMSALEHGETDWDAALFRAENWQREARNAFMQGYLSVSSNVLPSDATTIERLVRLFEIEKAFYELRYELAHRPGWVWIPMRGISELVRDSLRHGRRPSGDAQPSPA